MVGSDEAADEVLVVVLFLCAEVIFCDLLDKEAVVGRGSWLLEEAFNVSVDAGADSDGAEFSDVAGSVAFLVAGSSGRHAVAGVMAVAGFSDSVVELWLVSEVLVA
jgi:hypothetical protein